MIHFECIHSLSPSIRNVTTFHLLPPLSIRNAKPDRRQEGYRIRSFFSKITTKKITTKKKTLRFKTSVSWQSSRHRVGNCSKRSGRL